MLPETELLQLASEGNEAAFTSLFCNYKDKLYGFLFHLTSSSELTEDIIQDTFLRLWKDKELLKRIDNFPGYLFRMTHNHAVNALKRMANETSIFSELKQRNTNLHADFEHALESKEARQLLQDTLENLPPQQKLVFTLSREHGLKHEEIAQRLNISTSTVKNHLVQALRKIREHLHYKSNRIAGTYLLLYLLDKLFPH